jgi:hypothetical protein
VRARNTVTVHLIDAGVAPVINTPHPRRLPEAELIRGDLSEAEWGLLELLLPPNHGLGGRLDDRQVVN